MKTRFIRNARTSDSIKHPVAVDYRKRCQVVTGSRKDAPPTTYMTTSSAFTRSNMNSLVLTRPFRQVYQRTSTIGDRTPLQKLLLTSQQKKQWRSSQCDRWWFAPESSSTSTSVLRTVSLAGYLTIVASPFGAAPFGVSVADKLLSQVIGQGVEVEVDDGAKQDPKLRLGAGSGSVF